MYTYKTLNYSCDCHVREPQVNVADADLIMVVDTNYLISQSKL